MSVLRKLEAQRKGMSVPRLHRIAFAEPSPEDLEELERCPSCRVEVERLRREREQFLRARAPAVFIAGLDSSQPRSQGRATLIEAASGLRGRQILGGLAMVAAAVVLLSIQPNEVRLKGGGIHWMLFVGTGESGRPYRAGERLRGGDVLQPAMGGGDATGQVAAFLLEADGDVDTVLTPTPFAADSGRLTPLPQAIRLDDNVGHELLILVFSRVPFSADTARRRIADAYRVSGDLDEVPTALDNHPNFEMHCVPLWKGRR